METMDKKKLNWIKNPDTYRYLLFVVFFLAQIYYGINFMNSGSNYQQAISFRPFCIAFGLMVLTMLDVRNYLHWISLVYLPIWYFVMHVAYEKQWIPDVCKYEHVDVIRYGKLVALVWGIVLIAIVRDIIKNKTWQKMRRVNSLFGIVWILYAVWVVIFHREYYYITFFSLGFTALYYAMLAKPQRRELFFRAICDACLLSLVYVLYKSLYHRPFDTKRYMGYFSNSNMAGMYFATIVAVILFRINDWWHKEADRTTRIIMLVNYHLLFGFVAGIALFNYTRTTILGILFGTFTVFVLQMIREKKKWLVLLRYIIALLAVAVLFQATYLVIRYVPAKLNEPTYFDGEYDPEHRVMKNDPSQSEKYTSMAEYLRIVFGKWGIYINFEEQEATGEAATVEVDTERDVTNGRVEIWQAFLEKTNLTGHCPGHLTLESGYFAFHAHSTYIHILYQYGIVAGILFLFLTVGTFVYSIFLYWKKGRENKYLYLVVLLEGICVISQVTEWIGHPAYLICLMQFVGIGYLLSETGISKKRSAKEI